MPLRSRWARPRRSLRGPWALTRPVLRTLGRPRRPLAAAGRALHADLAESCPPPRRRQLAGESAHDSAEAIGWSLLEAAGCTSGQSGLSSPSRPEDSSSTDDLVALHSTVIMSSRRATSVSSTRAGRAKEGRLSRWQPSAGCSVRPHARYQHEWSRGGRAVKTGRTDRSGAAYSTSRTVGSLAFECMDWAKNW